MVEFAERARVSRPEFLRRQVDLVEPCPDPIEQQPRHPAGDGGGVFGAGQVREVQPLTPQALLLAEVDAERARPQAADDVHVRLPESPGDAVLLPEAQDGPELRPHARLLEDLSDRRVPCVQEPRTGQERALCSPSCGFANLIKDFISSSLT